MTRNEAVQESLNMAMRINKKLSREAKMAVSLREAMKEFGHECDVVAFAVLFAGPRGAELGSIARTDRHSMVAQCARCGQLLTAYVNPYPKPILFGRKQWREVILEGGANQLHCGYTQRQIHAVNMERVRGVMNA